MARHAFTLTLTGNTLSVQEVCFFVRDEKVKLRMAPQSLQAVNASHQFLTKHLGEKVIYGVNTGFGSMASYLVRRDKLTKLQENLVRSHAAGAGAPLPDSYVLSTMIVRLNTLLKGYSGVSPRLVRQLETFINRRIIPLVPEHGAVGTSGDLVQLAHIALALMGEGEVFFQSRREQTARVLKRLRMRPCALAPKEGLALINGTSVMTGIGALIAGDAERLLGIAVRSAGLALELVGGFKDSISVSLHRMRPHEGQVRIASILRRLLASSKLLKERGAFHRVAVEKPVQEIPEHVQEVYSFRCVPQILGPVFETYMKTKAVLEVELNSATDNPLIDVKRRAFLHGGNFHGDAVAVALDHLKASLVKLVLLSERRTNFFLHPKLNAPFPPFLNLAEPGLTLGLQGLQFVATSTAAQCQTLAFPHNLHSIPTNADNQDVVSMGADAALFAAAVVSNAYVVLAIELITLAQAVDCARAKNKLSRPSRALYNSLRSIFPAVREDRALYQELEQVIAFLKCDASLLISFG